MNDERWMITEFGRSRLHLFNSQSKVRRHKGQNTIWYSMCGKFLSIERTAEYEEPEQLTVLPKCKSCVRMQLKLEG